MTATKVAKTSLKNVNSRSFKIHRSSSMALNLSNVSEVFWSWILKGFTPLSICQNWPARTFPSQRKFLFYPKHYTRKRWFSEKKTLGKSRFRLLSDWSGNGPTGQLWQMESALSLKKEFENSWLEVTQVQQKVKLGSFTSWSSNNLVY